MRSFLASAAATGRRLTQQHARRRRALRAFSTLAPWLLLVGCGGGEPPKTADAPPETSGSQPMTGNMSASAEFGGLNEEEVTHTFERSLGALRGCLADGAKRVELLSGEIAFYVEIDDTGHAFHAHAERSSLGDRATEKCMLEVLRRQSWPRPVGGLKGFARNSFEFDMPNDVRPPTEWAPSNVAETLSTIEGELSTCRARAEGTFTATLYVDSEGAVISAGVAASSPAGEAAADCLVAALRKPTYPSPGSWPAKVSFGL